MTVDLARVRYAHWARVLATGIAAHQWPGGNLADPADCAGCAWVSRQVDAASLVYDLATAEQYRRG